MENVSVRRLCAVSYGSSSNAMLCSFIAGGNGAGTGNLAVATPGCDNNWNTYWVGTRTQWNVTKDFYMGATCSIRSWIAHRRSMGFPQQISKTRPQRLRATTRTTGRSGSVPTATSIPDRLIMDVSTQAPGRKLPGVFCYPNQCWCVL